MAQEKTQEGAAPGNGQDEIVQSDRDPGQTAEPAPSPEPEPTKPESAETSPADQPTPEQAPGAPESAQDRPEPDQAASEPQPAQPEEEPEPDELTTVQQVLRKLVNLIGIRAGIEVTRKENIYYANIKARHSNGLLIGRRGGTLRSIQYLTRLIVKQSCPQVPMIVVDVSGYRVRRDNFLRKKATAVARIVLETRREMALDLLNDKEMEIVQETLEPMSGIRVHALGTGARRNVIIALVTE